MILSSGQGPLWSIINEELSNFVTWTIEGDLTSIQVSLWVV
jgi:hypothetical protein